MRPQPFIAHRWMRLVMFTALLAAVACTSNKGDAKPTVAAKSGGIKAADLVPNLPETEWANVKYTFRASFPDGHAVYWSARFHNLGPGSDKVEVKATLTRPEGKPLRIKKDMGGGDCKVSKSPLKITMKTHEMSGTPDNLRLTAKKGGTAIDVTFKSTVPAWRAGGGRIKFGDLGFYELLFPVPHAEVTGTLTYDGQTVEVKGWGYGQLDRSDVAVHDVMLRKLEFTDINAEQAVHMAQFATTDNEEMTFLFAAKDGKVVLDEKKASVKYGKWWTDEKSEPKYKVPKSIVAKGKGGGVLGIKVGKLKSRKDELKNMNFAIRAIAGGYAKPFTYKYDAAYELKAGGVSIKGKGGRFGVNHINPPGE